MAAMDAGAAVAVDWLDWLAAGFKIPPSSFVSLWLLSLFPLSAIDRFVFVRVCLCVSMRPAIR